MKLQKVTEATKHNEVLHKPPFIGTTDLIPDHFHR